MTQSPKQKFKLKERMQFDLPVVPALPGHPGLLRHGGSNGTDPLPRVDRPRHQSLEVRIIRPSASLHNSPERFSLRRRSAMSDNSDNALYHPLTSPSPHQRRRRTIVDDFSSKLVVDEHGSLQRPPSDRPMFHANHFIGMKAPDLPEDRSVKEAKPELPRQLIQILEYGEDGFPVTPQHRRRNLEPPPGVGLSTNANFLGVHNLDHMFGCVPEPVEEEVVIDDRERFEARILRSPMELRHINSNLFGDVFQSDMRVFYPYPILDPRYTYEDNWRDAHEAFWGDTDIEEDDKNWEYRARTTYYSSSGPRHSPELRRGPRAPNLSHPTHPR